MSRERRTVFEFALLLAQSLEQQQRDTQDSASGSDRMSDADTSNDKGPFADTAGGSADEDNDFVKVDRADAAGATGGAMFGVIALGEATMPAPAHDDAYDGYGCAAATCAWGITLWSHGTTSTIRCKGRGLIRTHVQRAAYRVLLFVSLCMLQAAVMLARAAHALFGCLLSKPLNAITMCVLLALSQAMAARHAADLSARSRIVFEASDESNQVRVPKETKEWAETGWWKCEGPQPQLIPGETGRV